MNNRITRLFGNKKKNVLSVFYTAGFPELGDTIPIAKALDRSGADIIEIGIPFSDPIADGPTIQESNKIALENGMNVGLLVQQVKEIRDHGIDIPIILMGYLNPVMQYGVERFIKDAVAAGVDGVILPDMPLYEFEEQYRELFAKANLCNTFLISPTTSEERIRKIDAATEGFIYAVSASSTTGARGTFASEQVAYFQKLQCLKLQNPFLIGFGISNHETFAKACEFSAGAIVGSAFINLLRTSTDIDHDVDVFVNSLRNKS